MTKWERDLFFSGYWWRELKRLSEEAGFRVSLFQFPGKGKRYIIQFFEGDLLKVLMDYPLPMGSEMKPISPSEYFQRMMDTYAVTHPTYPAT